MDKFMMKYESGLNELKRKLDDCIQGMWRAVDYEYGNRTTLDINKSDSLMTVLFGDIYTIDRQWLTISYTEVGDSLIIDKIEPISRDCCVGEAWFGEGCAYSKDVLSLIGFEVVGKSEKEMISMEIVELKGRYERNKISVDRLTRNLAREKERMKKMRTNIEDLEAQMMEIDSKEEYNTIVEAMAQVRTLASKSDSPIVVDQMESTKRHLVNAAISLGYSEARFNLDSVGRYTELIEK